jgi:hypothetical protein
MGQVINDRCLLINSDLRLPEHNRQCRFSARARIICFWNAVGGGFAIHNGFTAPAGSFLGRCHASRRVTVVRACIRVEDDARQVALALHREREERYYASAVKEQSGPRLVLFPGTGHQRAGEIVLLPLFLHAQPRVDAGVLDSLIAAPLRIGGGVALARVYEKL